MANTTGKKYGGRKKGTPNKTTEEIRQMFSNLLDDNLERLQDDINELEPRERVKYLIDLAKFVVPTLKATEHTATTESKPIVINLGKGINPEIN